MVPHEVSNYHIKRLTNQLDNDNFTYSLIDQINEQTSDNILIVDKIGQLADLYKFADFAYVGGGFSKGVHSVIEPAAYNCNICFGPNIELLDEAKILIKHNYAKIIYSSQQLHDFLISPPSRHDMSHLFSKNNSKEILDKIIE